MFEELLNVRVLCRPGRRNARGYPAPIINRQGRSALPRSRALPDRYHGIGTRSVPDRYHVHTSTLVDRYDRYHVHTSTLVCPRFGMKRMIEPAHHWVVTKEWGRAQPRASFATPSSLKTQVLIGFSGVLFSRRSCPTSVEVCTWHQSVAPILFSRRSCPTSVEVCTWRAPSKARGKGKR